MKSKLFNFYFNFLPHKPKHISTESVPTLSHTDVPSYTLEYTRGQLTHILFYPYWLSSDGTHLSNETGEKLFNALRDHYEQLKRWRLLDTHQLTTYTTLDASADPRLTAISLVVATQKDIARMLDDYLLYRRIAECVKEN